MRKTILILALLAATPAVAQEAPPPKRDADRQADIEAFQQTCQRRLQRTGDSSRAKPLNEMKPARFERAVLRTIYGCPVPVYVRHYPERRNDR